MPNQYTFNERLRQVILLGFIIFLVVVLISELSSFMPGILGAITLYIVSRKSYLKLIYQRKWKKGLTAWLFMIGFIILVAIPIYFSITLVTPRITEIVNNPDKIMATVKSFSNLVEERFNIKIFTGNTTQQLTQKVTEMVPKLLNSTLGIITNLATMIFLLYYLLTEGHKAERTISKIIPLNQESLSELAKETRMLVRANAIGIPLISLIQGVTATIGYWIFGVENFAMWGFITGVCAFFPVVGTMIVWVPIVVSMFVKGDTTMAIGLLVYSLVVTGNVDYLARMTLMKKMGDVHPIITVLGVIIGLNVFGFIGLVFGPLLLSYVLILIKIYMNEFTASKADVANAENEDKAESQDKPDIKPMVGPEREALGSRDGFVFNMLNKLGFGKKKKPMPPADKG